MIIYHKRYDYWDDADTSCYGISLIDQIWVEKVDQQIYFQVLDYRDAAWYNHQYIVLIKEV